MSRDRRSVRKAISILWSRSRSEQSADTDSRIRRFAAKSAIRDVSALTLRRLAELFIETRMRASAPLSSVRIRAMHLTLKANAHSTDRELFLGNFYRFSHMPILDQFLNIECSTLSRDNYIYI